MLASMSNHHERSGQGVTRLRRLLCATGSAASSPFYDSTLVWGSTEYKLVFPHCCFHFSKRRSLRLAKYLQLFSKSRTRVTTHVPLALIAVVPALRPSHLKGLRSPPHICSLQTNLVRVRSGAYGGNFCHQRYDDLLALPRCTCDATLPRFCCRKEHVKFRPRCIPK